MRGRTRQAGSERCGDTSRPVDNSLNFRFPRTEALRKEPNDIGGGELPFVISVFIRGNIADGVLPPQYIPLSRKPTTTVNTVRNGFLATTFSPSLSGRFIT